jgi:hypothetical protein
MQLRSAADRVRRVRIDLWFPIVVVGFVLLLSAFGVSGSSVSIYSPSGAPDSAALVTGEPRQIRSDEWLAWSPMKTGRVQAGFPATQTYGLGEVELGDSWRPQLPSRSIGAALYSPFNLPLVVLPLEQGFALMWWLPFVACSLGLYAWLRAMRVDATVALAASLITTTAPSAVWWSGWLCQIIGAAAIPCAILVAATRLWERRRGWAIAVAVGGALAAANLPWFYQPWALACGLFIGGVTALWGLAVAERRRPFLLVVAIAGGLFAIESLVYLLHERSYYEALQDTVYPGQRRSDGGGINIGLAFSSLFPFALAGDPGDTLVHNNLSEVSMGWTVLLPLTASIAALARRTLLRDRERVLLFGTLVLATFLSAWCFIRFPASLARLTGLTLIPPERMAPLLGFFWTVGLSLVLADAKRRAAVWRELGRSGAVVVTAVTTIVAAWGSSRFRLDYLEPIGFLRSWGPVVLVAVLAALLFTRWRAVAVVTAVVVAVVSGVLVNPLTVGLGALDDSRASALVERLDERFVERGDGAWAADDIYVNGLLNAHGVRSLSSFNDPVVPSGWRVLDPRGRQEAAWNRFAYIFFDWSPEQTGVTIENPTQDQISVRIDPCNPRLDRLSLRAVVSEEPLTAACLAERARFRWQGRQFRVYERARVSR